MSENNKLEMNAICIGKYSDFYVMDGVLFNKMMAQGKSIEEYLAHEDRVFINGRKPFQVYEYIANNVHYVRANIVTFRSSGLIYRPFFETECVVVYNSQNPGCSTIRKGLSVEETKAKYNLPSANFNLKPRDIETIRRDSNSTAAPVLEVNKTDISRPLVTSLEKTVVVLGFVGFMFGIFCGLILGLINIILAMKSLCTENRNRKFAVLGMILSFLTMIEGLMGIVILLGILSQSGYI